MLRLGNFKFVLHNLSFKINRKGCYLCIRTKMRPFYLFIITTSYVGLSSFRVLKAGLTVDILEPISLFSITLGTGEAEKYL